MTQPKTAQEQSEIIDQSDKENQEQAVRQEICRIGRLMQTKGYIAATDGNISVRIATNRILCTPSGLNKGDLKPDLLVVVDLNGKLLEGSGRPSSEIGLHLSLYRKCSEIRAVVHSHAPSATAFALAGQALDQPFLTESIMALGPIPLAPYATPGTEAVGIAAAEFCPACNGVLLAHHGAVTWGEDLQQAWFRMDSLEHTATILLKAGVLTEKVKELPEAEARRLSDLGVKMSRFGQAIGQSGRTVVLGQGGLSDREGLPNAELEEINSSFLAVRFDDVSNRLILLDQTQLPNRLVYNEYDEPAGVGEAIKRLEVRGAPAIGVAAAYAYYLGALKNIEEPRPRFDELLSMIGDNLNKTRPTAVNLKWAIDRMEARLAAASGLTSREAAQELLNEARQIHDEDTAICRGLGEQGLTLLKPGMGLLTHCNAGALATSRYGTALAPIYLGEERGYGFKVFADETRPLLQGARLTAWELQRAGVDVTLICDSMASIVMQNGWIDAILVGCDRVAANGDSANKIGTSGLARIAHSLGIPFYIFAPTSTIDLNCPTGADIPIEERSGDEITTLWYAGRMAPAGVKIYNPAFDVTPAEYITAIVTEKAVLRGHFAEGLRNVKN
jgi:methylthioribose-1-phosphate isomerase